MEQDKRQDNAIIEKFILCSLDSGINPMWGNKPIRNTKFIERYLEFPFLVTVRSKAWVCGRSLAGMVGSNPAWGQGYLSLVSVVCCQVEVFASG
jgi:hypothetical protein